MEVQRGGGAVSEFPGSSFEGMGMDESESDEYPLLEDKLHVLLCKRDGNLGYCYKSLLVEVEALT